MDRDIKEILISEEQIQNRIAELGEVITRDYAGKDLVIVGVLKGVVLFFADMVRKIRVPCEMDFMVVSSYRGGTSSCGNVVMKKDVSTNLKGRHVLILEDIYDTGNSLEFVYGHLQSMEPASVKICTLLDKPSGRKAGVTLEADYVGFTIPDAFVVGYGLDYEEKLRNLPYVGIMKPEAYNKK